MGKTIQHGNPPAISYMDAMRLELVPGKLACQLQTDEFASWIQHIAPEAKWPDFDWAFFADRWAAMLSLCEKGVEIVPKNGNIASISA